MDAMKEVIEATPPELLSDVLERGVTVLGGGALLRGLPYIHAKMLGVPVRGRAGSALGGRARRGYRDRRPGTLRRFFYR